MRAAPPEDPSPFVAAAALVEPAPDARSLAVAAPSGSGPSRRDRRPEAPDPRRALAWALLGVVCFGFVLGPVACAMGERARLAIADEPSLGGARVAGAAIALGRVALVVHVALTAAALPFLVFVIGF